MEYKGMKEDERLISVTPRRTVLCVYGAVRGVGDIDSWGSDVEDEYHVSAEEDIRYSFTIC